MLAYVFWHWRQPAISREGYEAAQQAFHRALAEAPSDGFGRSFSHAIAGAPWANGGDEAYEDWYLVRDFSALGPLNDAAISASRQAPHDVAAALAGGGTAGLYRMRLGEAPKSPCSAQWFSKPQGVSYPQLFAAVEPLLRPVGGSLWMRQMVLGPTPEFCVLGDELAQLPPMLQMFAFALGPVWGGSGAGT